jgi:hypothetical protein
MSLIARGGLEEARSDTSIQTAPMAIFEETERCASRSICICKNGSGTTTDLFYKVFDFWNLLF